LIDAILDDQRLSVIASANSIVLVVEIERVSASIAFSEGSFACSAVLRTFLTIVLSVGILTNLAIGFEINASTINQVLIIIATTSLLFSNVLECECAGTSRAASCDIIAFSAVCCTGLTYTLGIRI